MFPPFALFCPPCFVGLKGSGLVSYGAPTDQGVENLKSVKGEMKNEDEGKVK